MSRHFLRYAFTGVSITGDPTATYYYLMQRPWYWFNPQNIKTIRANNLGDALNQAKEFMLQEQLDEISRSHMYDVKL